MRNFVTLIAALLCGTMMSTGLVAQSYDRSYDRSADFSEYVRAGAPTETLAEWRQRAQQGDAAAQVYLGMSYQYGEGVLQSNEQAARWYRAAAEQGYSFGQVILGRIYSNGVLSRNYSEALRWFRLAAAQGDAEGQQALGDMYREGRGVPRSYAEAVSLYRMAAEQGLGFAQWNLGAAYQLGDGVAQDYVSAYMWFNLAAASNDPVSMALGAEARQSLAQQMTPAEIARAQRLSSQCLSRNFQGC